MSIESKLARTFDCRAEDIEIDPVEIERIRVEVDSQIQASIKKAVTIEINKGIVDVLYGNSDGCSITRMGPAPPVVALPPQITEEAYLDSLEHYSKKEY
jgi:hypothetical protein